MDPFTETFDRVALVADDKISVIDGVVECNHFRNGHRIPCPWKCPIQGWPRSMFRLTLRGDWVLRRPYRADHFHLFVVHRHPQPEDYDHKPNASRWHTHFWWRHSH